MDNLEKMGKFLERYNLPISNHYCLMGLIKLKRSCTAK